MKVTFTQDQTTKHTVRFTEDLEDDHMRPYMGKVYLRKDQHKALGEPIKVEVEVRKIK